MNVKKRMKHLAALLAVALFVSSIPSTGIVSLAAGTAVESTIKTDFSVYDVDSEVSIEDFDTAKTEGASQAMRVALLKPGKDVASTTADDFYDPDAITYTASDLDPKPIVWLDNTGTDMVRLTPGVDYTYDIYSVDSAGKQENIPDTGIKNAGKYIIFISGVKDNGFTNTTSVTFTIAKADLSAATVKTSFMDDTSCLMEHDGKTKTPEFTVYAADGTVPLTKGVDYTVEDDAGASTDLGAYTATIKPVTDAANIDDTASKTKSAPFWIVKTIKEENISYTYSGTTGAYTIVPHVVIEDEELMKDTNYTLGKIYEASSSGAKTTTEGTNTSLSENTKYYTSIEGKWTSSASTGDDCYYTKEPIETKEPITINPNAISLISNCSVKVTGTYTYTGEPIVPSYKVYYTGVTPNVDITSLVDVKFTGNTNAGNVATCIVSADGKKESSDKKTYCGYVSSAPIADENGNAYFTIGQADFYDLKVTGLASELVYTSSSLTPSFKFTLNGKEITPRLTDDYTVAYTDKDGGTSVQNAGTYTATFTPASSGNFDNTAWKDTKTFQFEVNPQDINVADYTFEIGSKGVITTNASPLTAGNDVDWSASGMIGATKAATATVEAPAPTTYDTDYTVTSDAKTYTGGAYKATISGKGNYTGEIKDVAFTIMEALSATDNVTVALTDRKVVDSTTSTYVPKVTVKNAAGKVLGTSEYSVKFYESTGGTKDIPEKEVSVVKTGGECVAEITLKADGYYVPDNGTVITKVVKGPSNEASVKDLSDYIVVAKGSVEAGDDSAPTYEIYLKTDTTQSTEQTSAIGNSNFDAITSDYDKAGTDVATLTLVGKGDTTNVVGETSTKYSIGRKDIAATDFAGLTGNTVTGLRLSGTYTFGDADIAGAVAKDLSNGKSMVKGTDYDLTFYRTEYDTTNNKFVRNNDGSYKTIGSALSAVTDAGYYVVKIDGINNYNGTLWAELTVGAITLTSNNISIDPAPFTGKAAAPTVIYTNTGVTPNTNTTLEEGVDYTIEYYSNKSHSDSAKLTAAEVVACGEYYVIIKGIGNYSGTVDDNSDTFVITKADLATAKVEVEPMTYTGKALTPEKVIVKIGDSEIDASAYTVKAPDDAIDAGKYDVTVTAVEGNANLTGSTTGTFTINPKPYNKLTVSISTKTKIYNGKTQTTSVTVKDGSKTLKKGTDYSVKYGTNRKIGLIKVKVVMKGNYTGSSSIRTFRIDPATPSFSSLKSAKKGQISVKIKRDSLVTGYQVQVCRNSKFAKGTIKAATLTKNTSVSKTFTKLTSKKTYYVRVRSYKKANGKTYYGAWRVKTIKVK